MTTQAPPDKRAALEDARRRLRSLAIGYLLGIAAVAWLAATQTTSYVTKPMGAESQFMALVGPNNPSHPWLYALGMGLPVALAYGLILPAVFGKLPPVAADLGTLLLAPVTVAFAAYLARWLFLTPAQPVAWGGNLDVFATLAFIATPLPILAAAVRLAFTGELRGWLVFCGAALLHVGMVGGMLAANLLGGAAAGM